MDLLGNALGKANIAFWTPFFTFFDPEPAISLLNTLGKLLCFRPKCSKKLKVPKKTTGIQSALLKIPQIRLWNLQAKFGCFLKKPEKNPKKTLQSWLSVHF